MSFIEEFKHFKIPFEVLESATNNFSDTNCIGDGGFGKVYKGEILLSGVLTMVAVKRLDESNGQGRTEFWKEITMLFQYKHQNLVSLLGFCDEGSEKLLVYEYLSKKSLDLYLDSVDLTWMQRLLICHGAAKGLRYLHEPVEGSKHRVLHRDIKSANILLDHNWRSKITDFGLSRMAPANQEFTLLFSNATGTGGYCDPLYQYTGLLTKESDVYSFGVVLFEVLCGRVAYAQDNNDIALVPLAHKCYEENKLDTIIHSGIRDTISPKSLERFTAIAFQCLQMNREERPLMAKIQEEIEIAYRYQEFANISLPEVPMEEIEVATGNFKLCISEINEYYQVYEGELSISGGKPTMVFIRRFSDSFPGSTNLYLYQLIYFSQFSGEELTNILPVVGYCDHEEKGKFVVHKYAQRGSLDQYISTHTSTTLTWLQRLQICAGAAHGLQGLHYQRMMLRAIRSAKIFLDDNWIAHVCNFVISSPSSSTSLDDVAADRVYGAPEVVVSTGNASLKGDVYSFGVVLFEVLCGRLFTEEVDGVMLSPKLIKEFFEQKKLDEIVDPALLTKDNVSSDSLDTYSAIAYRCLHDDPKQRPSMDVVVQELEELLRIERNKT
uniref:receptor-like protein kinase FERONIA n=1 Tax=Erigeron canadensis TaxID=72917 RepID=UPI001CB95DC2|nr:receptor-like protein kinase FERONIA [Erigeron canadensis]